METHFMQANLILENLSNPALLFFLLGVIAVLLKSDLQIPPNSSKFISMYLLFSIGFKGGQELAHESFGSELWLSIFFGIGLSLIIPIYTFFVARQKLSTEDSGAIAAAYGSVSAVTFVTGASYLEAHGDHFDGHMVAIMAFMEFPAIVAGLLLIQLYSSDHSKETRKRALHHAFTNGSVILILGSLLIGFLADQKQAEGIKPFTTDIFKGFLAIFLLDMGIVSGKKLHSFLSNGFFPLLFGICIPLINGISVAMLSGLITESSGNRFMFSILAAGASYIAVPAAMKIAVPKANPGIYLPMALAVTFPINITIGMPLYYWICHS
jgi:hypothetical protein